MKQSSVTPTARTPLLPAEYLAEHAPCDMVQLAREWHDGQASAMYSLASTGAVWSWSHLARLSVEFGDDAMAADSYPAGEVGSDDGDALRECEAWCDSILAANPYAPGGILADSIPDPGGYNLLGVTDDGDLMCERCITDPANPVHPDDDSGDGWGIVGWQADGETESEEGYPCAHCGRVILAGYLEGDAS